MIFFLLKSMLENPRFLESSIMFFGTTIDDFLFAEIHDGKSMIPRKFYNGFLAQPLQLQSG